MNANDRLPVPCIVFLVLVGTLMAVVLRHGPGEDRSRKADDIVVDAGKRSAVTQAPRPTRGISQKDTSLPLDRIKKLGRTLTVQHLRDIVDLPTSFSADLDVLKRRAVAAAKVVPDGNTDGYVVKYYSGVNHTHHRLLENGVTGFASKPLAGVYFTEHCFDGDGKIVKAIANDKDGTRFVDRTFWYEGNRPSAMLTYGPSGYSFGEHGLYREGRLYLVARFDAIGTKLIV